MSTDPPRPPSLASRGSCKRASRKRPAKEDLNDECDSPDFQHDIYTSHFDLPAYDTYEADAAEEGTGDDIVHFGGGLPVAHDVLALLKEARAEFSGSKRIAGNPDAGELIKCALNGIALCCARLGHPLGRLLRLVVFGRVSVVKLYVLQLQMHQQRS